MNRKNLIRTIAYPIALLSSVLIFSPIRAESLFVLVDTGELFASGNGGESWTMKSALPVYDAVGLIAGETQEQLTLASRSGGIYVSADAGESWDQVGAIPSGDLLEIVGRSDGTILAMTRTGTVWNSEDAGTSFSISGTFPASDAAGMDAGPSGDLYVVTETGLIYQSSDGGEMWTVVAALPLSDAVSITYAGTRLLVLTSTGSTYQSVDSGVSWQAIGTVSQVGMVGWTETEGGLAAVTLEGHVATSIDGSKWSFVGSVNQMRAVAMATDSPTTTGVPDGEPDPAAVRLHVWPNPMAGSGEQIRVQLTQGFEAGSSLVIFDVAGRKIASYRPPVSAPLATVTWAPSFPTAGRFYLGITSGNGPTNVTPLVVLR